MKAAVVHQFGEPLTIEDVNDAFAEILRR